jgi:hypothetical protein
LAFAFACALTAGAGAELGAPPLVVLAPALPLTPAAPVLPVPPG